MKQESEERRPVVTKPSKLSDVCGLLELAGSLTYAHMLHIMVLG